MAISRKISLDMNKDLNTDSSIVGQAAASLAHEVRNPLGSMKLFSSLLRKELKDQKQALELLENIDIGMQQIELVISNMLRFAKNQSLEKGPLNLFNLIQGHIAECNIRFPEINFVTRLEGNPFIIGNEGALRQVIENIIRNASESMDNRGTIEVKACECEDGIQIDFKDCGDGFSPEMLEKGFEPFATSRENGTGLGLSIVQQIINAHSGSVELLNSEGGIVRTKFIRS